MPTRLEQLEAERDELLRLEKIQKAEEELAALRALDGASPEQITSKVSDAANKEVIVHKDEMHPDISAIDRFLFTSSTQPPEKKLKTLQKTYPNIEFSLDMDGGVKARTKGSQESYVLDPSLGSTEGIIPGIKEGILDLLDLGDVAAQGVGGLLGASVGGVRGAGAGTAGFGRAYENLIRAGRAARSGEAVESDIGEDVGQVGKDYLSGVVGEAIPTVAGRAYDWFTQGPATKTIADNIPIFRKLGRAVKNSPSTLRNLISGTSPQEIKREGASSAAEAVGAFTSGVPKGVINAQKKHWDIIQKMEESPEFYEKTVRTMQQDLGNYYNAGKNYLGKIISGFRDAEKTPNVSLASVENLIRGRISELKALNDEYPTKDMVSRIENLESLLEITSGDATYIGGEKFVTPKRAYVMQQSLMDLGDTAARGQLKTTSKSAVSMETSNLAHEASGILKSEIERVMPPQYISAKEGYEILKKEVLPVIGPMVKSASSFGAKIGEASGGGQRGILARNQLEKLESVVEQSGVYLPKSVVRPTEMADLMSAHATFADPSFFRMGKKGVTSTSKTLAQTAAGSAFTRGLKEGGFDIGPTGESIAQLAFITASSPFGTKQAMRLGRGVNSLRSYINQSPEVKFGSRLPLWTLMDQAQQNMSQEP